MDLRPTLLSSRHVGSGPITGTARAIRLQKTYLVTGGCGFIGSHLCDALVQQGFAVRVLDDLSTGSAQNLPDGVELHVGDITDRQAVRNALSGVAGCFHLAAIASVERSVEEWLPTHMVNLTGTVTLMEAIGSICQRGTVPIVYASSAAVYGDRPVMPLTENAQPRPRSAYAADKLGCEHHASIATHIHGIPSIGLRFFNVFGPRQSPFSPYSGVVSVFCDRLRHGRDVNVFGDGQQIRDYVFVSDVVTALLAAMQLAPSDPLVLNVCTGRPTTVMELARVIADLCGVSLNVRKQPIRAGEVRHSLGSRKRAGRLLALDSPLHLRAGLEHVLSWLDSSERRQRSENAKEVKA